MNLNSVADINSVVETITNHGYAVKPELFYNKQLLDTIRLDANNYVFYRVATTTPIQGQAEKLQLRRWAPLQGHTVPLAEGVPPMSDKGSMESYEIPTFSYGRYMEFTDRVNFELLDPVLAHYTKEYSIVAIETLDLLAREALVTIGQSHFANGRANFGALEIGDVGALDDLRVIVLGLKKQLVKPRTNGKFMVIGTPDFYFDMISDPLVEKYMTINQTTKGFFETGGAIPPMFEMEFYETMATDNSGEFVSGGNDTLRVVRFNTNTNAYEYANIDAATYKKAAADNYVRDSRTGEMASYIPGLEYWDIAAYNATIVDGFGEFVELHVHRVFVLGKDALIRTEIAGHGNAKMYVKKLGSTGVLDPIDQRQSIGFKIDSVGFGSARTEAVVLYYCIPSQANSI
ncbi:MAG: hypothetical protein EOL95_10315 [Bacteroidia bacterium]|nr:hypothetical protein [Bacteroidia bacterium]